MTGYTDLIVRKDLTFEQWALECARAFGALISMREDDNDAPIPEELPVNPYHANRLRDALLEEKRLCAMTTGEKLAYGQKVRDDALKSVREGMAKREVEQAKLAAMKKQVEAWRPPTPEHEGMKKFMLEQIEMSESDTSYYRDEIARLETKPVGAYADDALVAARSDIAYQQKELQKEVERTAERNRWLRALRESLKSETPCP